MDRESRINHYKTCAVREEQAAVRAATRESASIHSALADLYRGEVAKIRSTPINSLSIGIWPGQRDQSTVRR